MEPQNIYFKNRWITLMLVMLMSFMVCLDSSIVNVSLPTMARELHVNMEKISLVVTSYIIIITSVIIIFGKIGDLKGKTLIFKVGIVIFALSSLLCGFSNSLDVLIVARIFQAVGAACTMATNQAIITQVFPQSERGKALGMCGSAIAIGLLLGPPLGGIITQYLSWNYIFFVNVPIGIIAFILCFKFLPKMPPAKTGKLDVKGSILFFIPTTLFFGMLSVYNGIDFSNLLTDGLYILSIALFVAFVIIEKKVHNPLIDLKLFKNSLFSTSLLCGMASYIAINCFTIILPFYFQDVMNLSAGATGLLMMFSPIVLLIVAPISGHMSDKIGSEIISVLGLFICVVGYILTGTLTDHSSYFIAVVYICIVSIGNGMFQSPNTSLIMSTADKSKLSMVGSINALVRNIGQITGIIISTCILYFVMSLVMGQNVTGYVKGENVAFIDGMHYVFVFAAFVCGVGMVFTMYRFIKFRKKV